MMVTGRLGEAMEAVEAPTTNSEDSSDSTRWQKWLCKAKAAGMTRSEARSGGGDAARPGMGGAQRRRYDGEAAESGSIPPFSCLSRSLSV
ncbi:hypothetical protein TRIUR3_29283 [Triticum urartu]|uniref:Uncharacterized protein n=1 Tax=Triticum urartu TaxID=4572 RepID=M7ZA38_TRIUA|nr:hypothetical protein TRIUR3_29283 [Triticum urartu]